MNNKFFHPFHAWFRVLRIRLFFGIFMCQYVPFGMPYSPLCSFRYYIIHLGCSYFTLWHLTSWEISAHFFFVVCKYVSCLLFLSLYSCNAKVTTICICKNVNISWMRRQHLLLLLQFIQLPHLKMLPLIKHKEASESLVSFFFCINFSRLCSPQ